MIPYTAHDMIRSMDSTFELTPSTRRRPSLMRFITAVHSRFAR